MGKYQFSMKPKSILPVNTRYRKITSKLPVPGSLKIFRDLYKYEARSMHGQLPVVWDRAEGFQVFDKYGNRWIDFTSTIFVTNSGHSNRAVTRALEKQLEQHLVHTYTFASEIRAKFLKEIIAITPSFCQKAFLLSAGTEATECALKLMRMHGHKISPDKKTILSFQGNMHGRTMAAEMLKGDAGAMSWIGYKDPNILTLPFPYPWLPYRGDFEWEKKFHSDIEALKKKGVAPDNICGVIIESYQGWGAIFYPKPYIKALCNYAKKYNILVTFDEIQGGFGRTGKLFVFQHYGVTPDLVCLGKALSNGLPLSAVLGRRKIMDLSEIGSMSSTHSANPLCCAAALANLQEIKSRDLIKKSAKKGKILHSGLNKLKNKYPDYISLVSGKGLLAALIITDPKTHRPNEWIASKICEKAMHKGLLLVHTGRESVKLGPPLTIPDVALIEGIRVLDECFNEIKDK
ncbi:MAG: aspartate aminotransferase family protein [Candidatus Omnitrophica bacterium]|nr:aspartate aminotransferase family protein [Candidatus Omnitrophota bacterium]